MKKFLACLSAVIIACALPLTLAGCSQKNDTVVLRVCSWEEYIDLGEWDEDELIDIDNPFNLEGEGVFGENSMVDDFTEWFNSNPEYDFDIRVEYSTFGTNEDLYNRLSLGDVYDLVCPSDYMIMKLIAEDRVQKFSPEFLSGEGEESYYNEYVSPYINEMFEDYGWDEYAACYMWGTTGLVYNPEEVDEADVSTWGILLNEDYKRQVTIKDNVRDAYFATLGILNSELLTKGVSDEKRSELLNATDKDTIAEAEKTLKAIKENVYSFETDAGKADMVTGKVVANYQWSGDAVYIMDEADGDENSTELWYSVPDECANLWFDGWVMLKGGIDGNQKRQMAAEAFINFLSRPDNAVRNMYYIGYTSAIAGDTVFDYMEWNYGADEEVAEVDIGEYDLSYFFGEDTYISVDTTLFSFEGEWADGQINRGRQLFAQYPPENVIARSVVMLDFGDKLAEINRMWINVRCLDIKDFSPVAVGVTCAIIGAVVISVLLYKFRYNLFIVSKPKKGYEKVEK